jgi:hypothetical protein
MPRRFVLPLVLFALCSTAATAANVTPLSLPEGFSVNPVGEQRLISIAPDRTVAAVSTATDKTFRARALRWNSAGRRSAFDPLPVLTAPDRGESPGIPRVPTAVAAGPGVVYVSVSESFSGAYSGVSFEAQRWVGSVARRWTLPACKDSGESDQHVNAVDPAGRVALTKDITGAGSFTVLSDDSGALAPYALVIDGARCTALGRGVVLGLNGGWGAGYRGYLNGHLAPTNLNTIMQRVVAVRWHGTTLVELGEGAAYGVTAGGFAVGASAIAGRTGSEFTNFYGNPGRRYDYAVPHALAWNAHGARIAIERAAKQSVAYDVANDGTAVGMLQTADGRHFAFRWRAGRLDRLDDLPHPRGWRFESAYAIAPDGTIAGIGTLNGVATVFTWRDTSTRY